MAKWSELDFQSQILPIMISNFLLREHVDHTDGISKIVVVNALENKNVHLLLYKIKISQEIHKGTLIKPILADLSTAILRNISKVLPLLSKHWFSQHISFIHILTWSSQAEVLNTKPINQGNRAM